MTAILRPPVAGSASKRPRTGQGSAAEIKVNGRGHAVAEARNRVDQAIAALPLVPCEADHEEAIRTTPMTLEGAR
ncbi:hypothetical protein CMUS01_06130 [Colletotrichum musicola]|uniref:Uncharacterized protein n=1 Tax=Colletotrichum musicola TaxID=2175873 RepID=A0A8H6NIW8_9PEZI|nr:hypothetical protein CMUS01_06130 [Colletotrichum musicola]